MATAVQKPPPVQSEKVVFVSNLPFECTAELLGDLFENEHIDVAHVEVLKKGTATRLKSCGLATVTLKNISDKPKSLEVMDGKLCFGRPMIVRADKFVDDEINYVHKA